MASDFFGLRIALTALHAQRRGMEVTGHNVANANTEGYSRQRVNLAPDAGPITPARWSRWDRGGQGVEVRGTDRLRDAFLEARSRQEHAADASLRRTQSVLGRVEAAFGEPGDDGLAAAMSDFWAGWDDVANHPDDLAARAQLLERAAKLAGGLNGAAEALDSMRVAAGEQLRVGAAEASATAARVAELNASIVDAVRNGSTPNDLLDQRDLLVSRLAEQVGATARPTEGGAVDVYVGGTALVRGNTSVGLEVADRNGTLELRWDNGTNYAIPVDGGDLGGNLKAANEVLPRYRAQLDAVANRLSEVVNAQHQKGKDLNGDLGGTFFAGAGAAGIAVAVEGPAKLAAASGGASGKLDGANALALAELARPSAPGGPEGPDQLYRSVVVTLGVETQAVNQRVAIQGQLTAQVDEARDGVSGVNLDEEMTNMVAFQHAYEAAAKFMTAVDQMLDTLINRTGVVGR